MRFVPVLLALVATPASAEVQAVDADSFVIETVTTVAAPPDRVWATFRNPSEWWDKEHTYSGDSANLYMDAQATGCFCERIPEGKGSVEHGHIVYVAPGRMLRMTAALGPLGGRHADLYVRCRGDGCQQGDDALHRRRPHA